jgi:hypothetical protein
LNGGEVPDEPSNSELARRLDAIYLVIVSRPEYLADLRRLDDRTGDLRRDIDENRRDSDEKIRAVHQRVTDTEKSAEAHRISWRTVIYTGLIPALVALGAILAQLWLR